MAIQKMEMTYPAAPVIMAFLPARRPFDMLGTYVYALRRICQLFEIVGNQVDRMIVEQSIINKYHRLVVDDR